MEHRALALKYRPQVFADMVGQEHVTEVLSRALISGRVAHAFLLAGPRGVGKTTTARILAKALNCERRDPRRPATASEKAEGAPEPCNACPSCRDITAGSAMDVTEIDGASNRGIADVQMLRERVRFTPAGGRFRVVIIDEVHQLSGDAFAALLKTLEEPPAHLVFVFATTDPLKLPDTIRSRCQRYDLARVPLRKVADRLRAIAEREAQDPSGVKFTLDEAAALLLARQSEGSLRDAVSALDQVISTGESAVTDEVVRRVLGLPDHEVFFALAGAVLARDPRAALQALHAAFAAGLEPRDLAEGLGEHLRNVLVLRVDPEAADVVAAASQDLARYRAMGEGWSAPDLMRLLRLVADSTLPMRDSSQPVLHLEAAVLQMASLEPGQTLAEILERLREIEQRLNGAGGASGSPAAGGGGQRSAAPSPAGTRGAAPAPTGPPRPSGAPPRGQVAPAPEAGGGTATAVLPEVTDTEGVAPAPARADAELAERWARVVTGINERKRMLGAFLGESQLVSLNDDGLVLAMNHLHRVVLEDKENRALLSQEIERVFGRRLPITCRTQDVAPAPPPTPQDVQPLIERALQYFDGEVIQRPARAAPRPPRSEER
jgi:DNA polymerase-3 subunit gamma/tau